jgi:prepilin signal peptidase PulO-like enzyme (type II secretory pathway)
VSDRLTIAVAVVFGVGMVGPGLNHAILRWIGWRVVLPSLLGQVAAPAEMGRPRARCAGCGRHLAPAGLPAVPATAVGGRCRGCGARLAGWYLAVELATGVLFGVVAAVLGLTLVLVPVLTLVAGLVAMSAVDLAVMRIPTRFVYVTAGLGLAGAGAVAVVDGPADRLVGAAVGAVVYGGFLLVLHLVSPRALGFGDVRLATLIGAAVGWCGWRLDHPWLGPVQGVLNAALLAGVVGSLAGLVLMVVRGRDRPFPFGPALALGGLVVVLGTV